MAFHSFTTHAWRRAALATLVALATVGHASTWVDTAFWKPYAADPHTYALLSFDPPAPMTGTGLFDGPGQLTGDAKLTESGRFGGGLRVAGSGHATFPSRAYDPSALWIHDRNQAFSIEAWIRVEHFPDVGESAFIVRRPTLNGDALGFALFIEADGVLGMRVEPRGSPANPTQFKSKTGVIPAGEWVHVAGISCGGHMSMGWDTLYVNGREVWRGPATGAAGAHADLRAASLHVGGSPDGGGLIGWIDDVRIHSRVARLWEPDPMPWLERIAREGLPATSRALAPGREPRASLRFDDGVRPFNSLK